jgi:hypothetical protein
MSFGFYEIFQTLCYWRTTPKPTLPLSVIPVFSEVIFEVGEN